MGVVEAFFPALSGFVLGVIFALLGLFSLLVSFGDRTLRKGEAQEKRRQYVAAHLGPLPASAAEPPDATLPFTQATRATESGAADAPSEEARALVGAVLSSFCGPSTETEVQHWIDGGVREKWGQEAALRDLELDAEQVRIWTSQLGGGLRTGLASLEQLEAMCTALQSRAKARQRAAARLSRFLAETAQVYRGFKKGVDRMVQLSGPQREQADPMAAWWAAVHINLQQSKQQHRLHYQRLEELLPTARKLQQRQEDAALALQLKATALFRAMRDALTAHAAAEKALKMAGAKFQRAKGKLAEEKGPEVAAAMAEENAANAPELGAASLLAAGMGLGVDLEKDALRLSKRRDEAAEEQAAAAEDKKRCFAMVETELPGVLQGYDELVATDREDLDRLFRIFSQQEDRVTETVRTISRRMVVAVAAAGYTVAHPEAGLQTDLGSRLEAPTPLELPPQLHTAPGKSARSMRSFLGRKEGLPKQQPPTGGRTGSAPVTPALRGGVPFFRSRQRSAADPGPGPETSPRRARSVSPVGSPKQGMHRRSDDVSPASAAGRQELESPESTSSEPPAKLMDDDAPNFGSGHNPSALAQAHLVGTDSSEKPSDASGAERSRSPSPSPPAVRIPKIGRNPRSYSFDEVERRRHRSSSPTGRDRSPSPIPASGAPHTLDAAKQPLRRPGPKRSRGAGLEIAGESSLDMRGDALAALASRLPSALPNPLPSIILDNIGQESCVWANALCGRVYRDAVSSASFRGFVTEQLQAAINEGSLPEWLDELRVSDLRFEAPPPILKNMRWVPTCRLGPGADLEYDTAVDADVLYTGGVAFSVRTRMWLNWPTDRCAELPLAIHIQLKDVVGRVRFGVRKLRTFTSFLEEPFLRFEVHSEFGRTGFLKDVPRLDAILVQRIKTAIRRSFIYPKANTFDLLWPREWWPDTADRQGQEHSKADKHVSIVTGDAGDASDASDAESETPSETPRSEAEGEPTMYASMMRMTGLGRAASGGRSPPRPVSAVSTPAQSPSPANRRTLAGSLRAALAQTRNGTASPRANSEGLQQADLVREFSTEEWDSAGEEHRSGSSDSDEGFGDDSRDAGEHGLEEQTRWQELLNAGRASISSAAASQGNPNAERRTGSQAVEAKTAQAMAADG